MIKNGRTGNGPIEAEKHITNTHAAYTNKHHVKWGVGVGTGLREGEKGGEAIKGMEEGRKMCLRWHVFVIRILASMQGKHFGKQQAMAGAGAGIGVGVVAGVAVYQVRRRSP